MNIYGYECTNPDPEDCGVLFEVVVRDKDGNEIWRDQTLTKCPLCGAPAHGLTEDEYAAAESEPAEEDV